MSAPVTQTQYATLALGTEVFAVPRCVVEATVDRAFGDDAARIRTDHQRSPFAQALLAVFAQR